MDEKGYVMSGLGFLLLIPVMILIPMAISLEVQSNIIPQTFVKTDTLFQTYKDIQADINSKVSQFTSDPKKNNGIGTYGVVYNYQNSSQFANNISYLYQRTQVYDYQNAFAIPPNNTVDSLDIQPAFTSSLNTGNLTGTIPLINGIKIDYKFNNQSVDKGNNILYSYSMTVTVNMTIKLSKNNNGLNQSFITVYPVQNAFQVNSSATNNATAINNVNIFFTNLNTNLRSMNICME